MSYLLLEFGKFKAEHQLSGIALLVDDKICLVLPQKYKGSKKYSIPKGHIEADESPFSAAHRELKEETGIDIGLRSYENNFRFNYLKNRIRKSMEVFIINLTKDEYKELKKQGRVSKRNTSEIADVQFVNKKEALKLVEPDLKKLIRYIYKIR